MNYNCLYIDLRFFFSLEVFVLDVKLKEFLNMLLRFFVLIFLFEICFFLVVKF